MRLRIGWPVGPLMLVVAALQAGFAVLFFIRSPIATGIWPLPETGEMSMIFLASIFAAAAASTAWSVLWRLPSVRPEWSMALWVYTSVVIYSGALAAYYLFLAPATRIVRTRPRGVAEASPSCVA